MVEWCPTAVFSKPKGENAYRTVHQHREFESAEYSKAFQRVCQSFEWRASPSNDNHAPCHGILRLGDAILLAKFRDIGRDAAGRPHTLRIDVLLTRAENFESSWRSFTQIEPPQEIPPVDHLKILGDPATYWSSEGAAP